MTTAPQETDTTPPGAPEAGETVGNPGLFDLFYETFKEQGERAQAEQTLPAWLDTAAALELFRRWTDDPDFQEAFEIVEAQLDEQLLTPEERGRGKQLDEKERSARIAEAMGWEADKVGDDPTKVQKQLRARGLELVWEGFKDAEEVQNLATAKTTLAYIDNEDLEGAVVDEMRQWGQEVEHREVLVKNFKLALERPQAIAGELARVELPNGRTWDFSPYEMYQLLISGEGNFFYAIETHLPEEIEDLSTVPDHRGRLYIREQDLFNRLGINNDQRAQTEVKELLERWSEDFFVAANLVYRIWEPIWEGERRGDPEAKYTPLLRPPRRILPMLYGEEAGGKKLIDDLFSTLEYYVKIFPGNRMEKSFSRETLGQVRQIFKGILYPFSRYLGGYAKEAFWLKRNFPEKLRPWAYISYIKEAMGNRLFGDGSGDIVETQVTDILARRTRIVDAIDELKSYNAIADDFTFANRYHPDRLDDYLWVLGVARVEDPTLVLIDTKEGLVVKDLTTLEYSQGGEKTKRASEVLRFFSQGEFYDVFIGDFGELSQDGWEFQFSREGKWALSDLLAGLAQKKRLSAESESRILFQGTVEDLRKAYALRSKGKKSDIPLDVLGGITIHDGPEELWDFYGGWIGTAEQVFNLSFDVHPETEDMVYWHNYRTIYSHLSRDAMLAKQILRVNGEKLKERDIGQRSLPPDFNRDGQCEVYLRDDEVESATITEEVLPLASGNEKGKDYVLDRAKMQRLLEDEYEEKVLASLAAYGLVREKGKRKERIEAGLRQMTDQFRAQLADDEENLEKYRTFYPGLFPPESPLTDRRHHRINQAVERLLKLPFFPSLMESMAASAIYKTSVVTCILPRDRRERLAVSSLVSDIPDPRALEQLIQQAEEKGEVADLMPYFRNWMNMYAECVSAVINGQDNLSLPVVLASILGKQDWLTTVNSIVSPTATKIVAFSGLMHSAVGDFGRDKIGQWVNRRAELVTSARQEGYSEPVMAQTRGLAALSDEVVMRQVFRWVPSSKIVKRIFKHAHRLSKEREEKRTIVEISREKITDWMKKKLDVYQKDRRTYYQALQMMGLPVDLL